MFPCTYIMYIHVNCKCGGIRHIKFPYHCLIARTSVWGGGFRAIKKMDTTGGYRYLRTHGACAMNII